MQRAVVAVRKRGEASEADFEVPTDLVAAELAEQFVRAVGAPDGNGPLELRAETLGRALRPEETLADAGLWDGATLVLARSGDPAEDGSRRGGALVIAAAPTQLVTVPAPPPVLAVPMMEPASRPMVPLVASGAVLLAVLIAAVIWFERGRDAPPIAIEVAPTAAVSQPTRAPTSPPLQIAPDVAPPSPTSIAVLEEELVWRDLLTRLDVVWGVDWPASITLLQSFHTQYPTRTAATDKLYAALIEYGKALRDAGAMNAAGDAFDQAVRLQPQRVEARSELAALTPPPTPVPAPVVAAPPIVAPTQRPTSVPPTPTLVPVVTEPAVPTCDVRSSEIACPLADGASFVATIDAPDGRHFYWFGVPVPGLQLRVETSGTACPCIIFLFSDQLDGGNTPMAQATGVLDRLMTETGPFLLELAPNPRADDPQAAYTLSFGLKVPSTPVPAPVEQPTVPPTPTPSLPPEPEQRGRTH